VKKGIGDAILGEAIGLNEVLDVAINLQLIKVIFELDAQVVVQEVKSVKNPRSTWGRIV
jgi:hypothetical protein